MYWYVWVISSYTSTYVDYVQKLQFSTFLPMPPSILFSNLHEVNKYNLQNDQYLRCGCIFSLKRLNVKSIDNAKNHLQTLMPSLSLLILREE